MTAFSEFSFILKEVSAHEFGQKWVTTQKSTMKPDELRHWDYPIYAAAVNDVPILSRIIILLIKMYQIFRTPTSNQN